MKTTNNINQRAALWRVLAGEQEMLAALGLIAPDVASANAALYRRTAESIERGFAKLIGAFDISDVAGV